jgi:hypothetical protein
MKIRHIAFAVIAAAFAVCGLAKFEALTMDLLSRPRPSH